MCCLHALLCQRFAICLTSECLVSLLQAIINMLTSLKSAQAGCKLLAEALCWLFLFKKDPFQHDGRAQLIRLQQQGC